MPTKSPKPPRPRELIRKLRKPLAPPTRVADEERKYKRAREQERLRRENPDSIENQTDNKSVLRNYDRRSDQ
jgi:hypothetical protein